MHIYSMMREFADSWALLSLTLVFIAVFAWAFRPGGRKVHQDTADIPFRHDDKPLPVAPRKEAEK